MGRKRKTKVLPSGSPLIDPFQQALNLHSSGRLDKAEKQYRSLLKKQPGHAGALVNLGQLLRTQGRHEEALTLYQRAVTLPDVPAAAWFNLANAQMECSHYQDAETSLHKLLELEPGMAQGHYQLANLYRRQDRLQDAITNFDRALEKDPALVSAWLDKGNTHRAAGQTQLAIESYLNGLQHAPDDWRLHYSLARILDLQRDPRFETHLEQAVAHSTDPWSVYYGLAETRMDDRNYTGAEAMYRRCLELKPEQPRAAVGLGAVLMRQDRSAEAERFFQQAAQSDDISLLSHLATVIWEHKFFNEAIKILKRIVDLDPGRADTMMNLAKAYVQNWHLDLALATLEQGLQLDPGNVEAAGLKATILTKQGRVDDSLAAFRDQYDLDRKKLNNLSSIAFCSLYSDRLTVQDKAALHRELARPLEQPRDVTFANDRDVDRRLRVGYVSADFRDQHPVGIFITPVIELHDREQVDVFCYYNSQTWDGSTHRIHGTADHWRDVAGWSDERLGKVITDDRIDILVDLSGHTAHNRLALFGSRAAPVQVSMIGYPHSTGLTQIDYFIADPWVCPPDTELLYSERIERLPMCIFNYLPEDRYGSVDVEAARQRDHVVFGSFNNIPKVTPATIRLWADVLKAVQDSRLKLKAPSFMDAGCRDRYRKLFEEQGIDSDRLQIVGPSGLADMMREYGDIDIALDPIPYNGGTTTVQALWMGAPVITLTGGNFCGRMGLSILSNIGLQELVAVNHAEYINIARTLAGDRQQLLAMKAVLRQRMQASALCDNQAYTRELEHIYRKTWLKYCQSGQH